MESVRRCEDCRRIVPGTAGDACPFCGSGRLLHVAAQGPATLKHPSVLTLVLTFSIGLVLIRILMIAFGTSLITLSPSYSELLWQLQFTSAVSAILYLILRRSEGDFRALLMVSLALFVATEVTGALAKEYGLLSLNRLCAQFNLTLFIFSGIALSAALSDGRRADRFQASLISADLGFLFLAAARTFLSVRSREMDERFTGAGTMVLSAVIIGVAVLVIRGELRGRQLTAPTPPPHVPPVEKPAEQVLEEVKIKNEN
jgi:hypothetical protein